MCKSKGPAPNRQKWKNGVLNDNKYPVTGIVIATQKDHLAAN
jgi:hypothetical protein